MADEPTPPVKKTAAKRTAKTTTPEGESAKSADRAAELLAKRVSDLSTAELIQLIVAAVRAPGQAGDLSRVHVNSGPPGFANSGGHANFDPKTNVGGQVSLPSDLSRVHVNSGPPGFANSGGHANFDPKTDLRDQVQLPDGGLVTLPPGKVDMVVRGFRITR